MRFILPAVLLFLFLVPLSAQEANEALINANLNTRAYAIDSNAGAVILSENCIVTIEKTKSGYTQKQHVSRIVKVLMTTGLDMARVSQVFRGTNTSPAKLENIKGTTWTYEDGRAKKSKLDKSSATITRLNENYSELTFTMPDVKTGSVLAYEYDISSQMYAILPDWEFKGKVPKLVSVYEIAAPGELQFTLLAGNGATLQPATGKDGGSMRWQKENIAAIKPEPFAGTPDNFRELLIPAVMKQDDSKDLETQWKAVNDELWQHEFFGKVASSTGGRLRTIVDSVTRFDKAPLAKAKSIFNYARVSFDYNNNEGILARRPIDQITANRIASEAEINLAMVAMMRMAGLNASPVIVSKLPMPHPNLYLPVSRQFNYTLAVVTIDTTKYFLDGSNFFNAFGELPIYCYNGYGRIVNEKGGAPIILRSGNLKDNNVQLVKISGITDTSFIAEVTDRKGNIEAGYLRNVIGGQDTTIFEKYIRKRSQPFGGAVNILSAEAEHLFEPEQELVIKYKLRISRPDKNELRINTNIMKFFSSNPFIAATRTLPVEFPTCYEYAYNMTIQVPPGMKPEFTRPEELGDIVIKGLESTHDITYDEDTRTVTVSSTLNISRNTFSPGEYNQLQLFFSQMIARENSFIRFRIK